MIRLAKKEDIKYLAPIYKELYDDVDIGEFWSIESAEAEINTLKERPYEANNKACKCREYEQRKAALYRSADQNTVHGGVIVFLFLFAQNAHLLSLLITYKLL